MERFNCSQCGKMIVKKDQVEITRYHNDNPYTGTYVITFNNQVGIQKKLFGRHITTFLCYRCLLNNLRVEPEVVNEMIESFKEGGCTLFS